MKYSRVTSKWGSIFYFSYFTEENVTSSERPASHSEGHERSAERQVVSHIDKDQQGRGDTPLVTCHLNLSSSSVTVEEVLYSSMATYFGQQHWEPNEVGYKANQHLYPYELNNVNIYLQHGIALCFCGLAPCLPRLEL